MPGRLSALAVAGGTPASAAVWGSHAAGCGCGGFRSRAASSEKRGSLRGVRRGFPEEGALELGLEEAQARGAGAAVTLGRARGVRCWGPVGSRGAEGLIAGTGDTGSHQSPGGDGRAVQGRRGRLSTPGSGPLTAARAVRPPSLGTGHERAGRAGGLQRVGLQGPGRPDGPGHPGGTPSGGPGPRVSLHRGRRSRLGSFSCFPHDARVQATKTKVSPTQSPEAARLGHRLLRSPAGAQALPRCGLRVLVCTVGLTRRPRS